MMGKWDLEVEANILDVGSPGVILWASRHDHTAKETHKKPTSTLGFQLPVDGWFLAY